MKKDIFAEMVDSCVTFAIINNKKFDENFIIVSEKDSDKVKSLDFNRSKDKTDLFERKLTKKEIKNFQSIKQNFKHLDILVGDVYELPNNSFKEYYEKINKI